MTDNAEAFFDGQGLIAGLLSSGESVKIPDHWLTSYQTRAQRNRGGRKTESPSSLIKYVGCPLSWFAERHAPENQGGVFVPNTFGVLGTAVHRVIELFYKERPANRDEETLYEIKDDVWEALTTGDIKGGIIDANTLKDFQYAIEHPFGNFTKQGGRSFIKKRVDTCIDNLFAFDDRPERTKVIAQEKWSRAEINGISFNGRVDLIVESPKGGNSVIDYKTGKSHLDEDAAPSFDDLEFFKSGMYSVTEPGTEYIEQWYLMEELNVRLRATEERKGFVNAVIDEVTSQMNQVENTGELRISPATSQDCGQCAYCPIKDVCPAWNSGMSLIDIAESMKDKE